MRYKLGIVFVLIAGALWSFHGLIIRQIESAEVWTILTWRSIAMVPVLFALLAVRSKGAPLRSIRKSGLAGVLGGLGLVAAMGGAILAFQTTTVANAAFLLAASPFLAALLGRLVLGEPVAHRTKIAIGIAVVGIFIMVKDGLGSGALLGNIAGLVSALGFASFTVALRWRDVEDSLPASLLGALFAALIGAGAAVASGQYLGITLHDLFWVALMGVVTMSGGNFLYTLGSRSVPSAELTLLSNTEVLLSPFWVWLILGELASPATFFGGAIVLTAIVYSAISRMRGLPPNIAMPAV